VEGAFQDLPRNTRKGFVWPVFKYIDYPPLGNKLHFRYPIYSISDFQIDLRIQMELKRVVLDNQVKWKLLSVYNSIENPPSIQKSDIEQIGYWKF
jgi:hypothetical protein